MINYINKALESTRNPEHPQSGLVLSKIGEEAVEARWNKSEKNGGYNESERNMVGGQV